MTSATEVVDGVARVRGLGRDEVRKSFANQRERLHEYIANMEPPYAADRILDELDQLDVPETTPEQAGVANGFVRGFLRKLRTRLPQAVAPARSDRRRQKLGDIDEEEIRRPLTQWAEVGVVSGLPNITRFNSRLWALH